MAETLPMLEISSGGTETASTATPDLAYRATKWGLRATFVVGVAGMVWVPWAKHGSCAGAGLALASGLLLGVVAATLALPVADSIHDTKATMRRFGRDLARVVGFAGLLPLILAMLGYVAACWTGCAATQPFTYFNCCAEHRQAGELFVVGATAWLLQPWNWVLGLWLPPKLGCPLAIAVQAALVFLVPSLRVADEGWSSILPTLPFTHPVWWLGILAGCASWAAARSAGG